MSAEQWEKFDRDHRIDLALRDSVSRALANQQEGAFPVMISASRSALDDMRKIAPIVDSHPLFLILAATCTQLLELSMVSGLISIDLSRGVSINDD